MKVDKTKFIPSSTKVVKKRNDRSPLLKTSIITQSSKSFANYSSLQTHSCAKKLLESGSKKCLKVSSEEDKMIDVKTFDTAITSRAAQMEEVLRRIENNENKLSKEELSKQLKNTLKMFFTEIISLDPYFGLILSKIKTLNEELYEMNIQKLTKELKETEAINADLVKEVTQEKKKVKDIEQLNKSLITANESLKKEIAELRTKLFTVKNQLTEAVETQLPHDVLNEIDDLYNEAQYMRKVNASLNFKLRQAQTRENALVALIQNDKGEVDEILEKINKKCSCIIEVGKHKVKIPMLDLSRVNYGVSCEDSESSEHILNKELLSH